MKETSKCYESRLARGDFARYLNGSGINVGAGDDPLRLPPGTGAVRPWDQRDGDAQHLRGVADGSLDFCYSSHCLEHMRDVAEALRSWARVVRPGGWLYVVVPDFRLYEKLSWPSMYNDDHKHTFSLDVTRGGGRPNHWHVDTDVRAALSAAGAELVEARLEDDGYDYDPARAYVDQTRGAAVCQIALVARRLPA